MQSSATTVSLRSNSPKKSAIQLRRCNAVCNDSVNAKLSRLKWRIVSPEALGRSVTAIVEVTLDTDRPKVVEEFQRAIQAAPEVLQAYYVTGSADYILIITAKNMADYEAFACEFLSKRPHVKHFRTSIVMRRVKWGMILPIKTD